MYLIHLQPQSATKDDCTLQVYPLGYLTVPAFSFALPPLLKHNYSIRANGRSTSKGLR